MLEVRPFHLHDIADGEDSIDDCQLVALELQIRSHTRHIRGSQIAPVEVVHL